MKDLALEGGPPELAEAAMEAARQFVYKPALLNGELVGMITTIDIPFILSQ